MRYLGFHGVEDSCCGLANYDTVQCNNCAPSCGKEKMLGFYILKMEVVCSSEKKMLPYSIYVVINTRLKYKPIVTCT